MAKAKKELETITPEDVGQIEDVLGAQLAEVAEVEEIQPDPISLRTTLEVIEPKQFIASVKLRDPYTLQIFPKGNPVVVEKMTGWLRSQIAAGLIKEL